MHVQRRRSLAYDGLVRLLARALGVPRLRGAILSAWRDLVASDAALARQFLSAFASHAESLLNPQVPFVVAGLTPATQGARRRYAYQAERVDFAIAPGDRVLDVGSGDDPFPLATVLADAHSEPTSHRTGRALERDARPFVVCDLMALPFAAKEFDFVYCSHVLEHVDDPVQACRELMRVGKRGYIETPTQTSDLLFNYTRLAGHHRWHVAALANTLVFIEWRPDERRDLGTDFFFKELTSPWRNPFQELHRRHLEVFVSFFSWRDAFSVVAVRHDGSISRGP